MSTTSKTVTIGKKSIESMWAGVIAGAQVDVQPPGSMTTTQFAERTGLTRAGADGLLRRMTASGAMKKFSMRLSDGGSIRKTSVYLPK